MQQQFYEEPQQREQKQAMSGITSAPHSTGRSTWPNILYLLSALPLGIFYFTFLVTALSLGFGLLAIWIGLPIL